MPRKQYQNSWIYPAELTITFKVKIKANGFNREQAMVNAIRQAETRVSHFLADKYGFDAVVGNRVTIELYERYAYGKPNGPYVKCTPEDVFEHVIGEGP